MKILLAIDDSKSSEAAGLYLAGEMGAQIPDLSGVWEARLEQGKELVARTAERPCGAGLKVSTSIEEGDPKARILDCAAAWSADLIVVGSSGRKGLSRFLLGSVLEAVARQDSMNIAEVKSQRGAGARRRVSFSASQDNWHEPPCRRLPLASRYWNSPANEGMGLRPFCCRTPGRICFPLRLSCHSGGIRSWAGGVCRIRGRTWPPG